ncbi:MAG: bifunctional [glutamate--ammonia ligase]-adenylyl-L-tyrosine phosphorylase/[glutamate--ammonia-ligase] adenylyltransferase [Alphaproteobacteria bacterium]|nr:bifunctional [glutamate--ammonia ligase]-adenylyl-L-tyrosine phosphorylase/[glutamate--ammonia-ligase] adenylyltransferase [Alphaproteobacteria bacterium]
MAGGQGQKNSGTKATAAQLLRHSPYLSGLATRWPEITALPAQEAHDAARAALTAECLAATNRADVMAALRRAKQKIALLTALADLSGVWDDIRVMQTLSDFADAATAATADHLLREAHTAGTIRLAAPKTPQKDCGMSIIALGKWGAHELNYSSDIDLMVLFDPLRTPIKDKDAAQNFFIRFTRDLAQMLEMQTTDGYVFRCDLRLRPDPGAMPLAVSLGTAEIYYGSLGQNWERAAMTKSRPVAGDTRIAADFTRLMTAWIWRRNLDFAAIQDIHSIKRQINAKQSQQGVRRGKAKSENPFLGVNVKLGHGGIREIEFYAQTQQLIFGGRDMTLRQSTTLGALDALCAAGHVPEKDRTALHDAYLFLRRIEHRLQMIDDRQTHSLPVQPDDFAALAAFAGYADAAALCADLARHMGYVQKCYAALFVESQTLSQAGGNLVFTGVEDDPDTLQTLRGMGFDAAEKVTAAIRGWHHGRYRAVRSERARQILTEITPQLLATLAATPQPDEAFIRFDRFLEKLPSGIPIFSMFAHHPQLLGLVAEVMGTAPALAEWLGTHPQVLDGVISRDFFGRLPNRDWLEKELAHRLSAARPGAPKIPAALGAARPGALKIPAALSAAHDYQDVLDITRRWAREKRFHAGIHILRQLSKPQETAAYLSDIAEACLRLLTPAVEAEFAKAHGRIKGGSYLLLAMGSFAARRMFTDSDLDIIALYSAPDHAAPSDGIKPLPAGQYYIRLTQRLITAITAPTSESILYNIDARLRPAGDDGPLAVSVGGFLDYHDRKAWTWEHMSLIRHRIIYGDTKAAGVLSRGIAKILSRPRDENILLKDVADMQARVRKEFGSDNRWDLKYRKGGLMDQLFAVQYLQLKYAAAKPAVLAPDIMEAIETLRLLHALTAAEAKTLSKAQQRLLDVQMFLRLSASLPFDPLRASAGLQTKMVDILKGAAPKTRTQTGKSAFKAAAAAFLKDIDAADKICRRILQARKSPAKKKRATGKAKARVS